MVNCALFIAPLWLLFFANPAPVANGQSTAGFINIDCGKPEGYIGEGSGSLFSYVSDAGYINTGEIHNVASASDYDNVFRDVRSFPIGERNCYSIRPVEGGRKYLVRAWFMYGNYDGRSSPPLFDLYLGTSFWGSVSFDTATSFRHMEVMTVTRSSSIPLCLVNVGTGTPFISGIEVRPLPSDLYGEHINETQSLIYVARLDVGSQPYVSLNGDLISSGLSPPYLKSLSIGATNNPSHYEKLHFSLVKTNRSNLPPILNAAEVYVVMDMTEAETDSGDGHRKKNELVVKVVASVCSVVFLLLMLSLLVVWSLRRHRPAGTPFLLESKRFTSADLVRMTNNFRITVGRGGFGSVYHGVMDNNVEVAVKILSNESSQGPDEFQTEARLLATIHHKNLVQLVGYCSDVNHLALVYEYMAEGSLSDHLFGKAGGTDLFCWKKRLCIAIEAAQGLQYLHDGCTPPIVHRDIKTSNILLNQKLEAKIADFGFSKILPNDFISYVSTKVVGTRGYIDPEYYYSSMLNEKTDVYSFGVVLLELVTGLPAIIDGPEKTHLVHHVEELFRRGDVTETIDERLQKNYDINSIWKVIETALLCTSQVSAERPTMAAVLASLKCSWELELDHEERSSMNPGTDNSISIKMFPSLLVDPSNPSAR